MRMPNFSSRDMAIHDATDLAKLLTGKFSSSEYISRRDVLRIGNVIVNIGGITSIHWAQV